MINNLKEKLNIIYKYLDQYEVDGLLLFSPVNRRWFLEFESSYGWLFINKNKIVYIVDARYYLEVSELFKNQPVEVIKLESNLNDLINQIKIDLKLDKLLIESDYLTLNTYEYLTKFWNQSNLISFVSAQIREVKFDYELKYLKQAANIICDVYHWLLTYVKPGLTELEIAKQISIKILEFGGDKNSFDPIVAANINGANPHHKPSNYKLQDGDMITIDLGCSYMGYASDMTRTFVLGTKLSNPQLEEIYQLVLDANLLGIEKATNKISGHELDLTVREFIDKTKYKGMFSHGLGHGVGIEVHELPNANASNKNKFVNNNVITVEPGIYCSNVGGVRIEDTIVINNNKPIILTDGVDKYLRFLNYK